ncbi:MAG: ATP-binding protein [Rhodocyclaceae bacterium]
MTRAPSTPISSPSRSSRWLRFALPLLVLSILTALVGSLAQRKLSEEIRRETHRTLAVIAEQKREQIEAWLHETQADAELFFGPHSEIHWLLNEWLDDPARNPALLARIEARLTHTASGRGWTGVAVVDRAGNTVVSVGDARADVHVAQMAQIQHEPRIELVDLYLAPDGEARYGVLAPIGGAQDTPLGTVYLTWKAKDALFPLVSTWPVPTRSAETYLVRRNGEGVRYLTPLRHTQDPALSLTLPLEAPQLPAARAAQGQSGILAGGVDYRGVPVLAYAAAVAGTPWLMLAEIDEREAYSGIDTTSRALALIVALVLLLVYSGGYLLWRRDRQRQELLSLQHQRAADARFRVIFEQAPLGVVLVDSASGRIAEANRVFGDIVGLPAEALAGRDPLELTHPDDRAASRAQLARLRQGHSAGYRLNKRYLRPDGSIVWANLTCAPVQVSPDTGNRYLFIVEDITERKRYEHDLQQASQAAAAANAAKSEFLAHMSHEIRTPMNAVLGLAQVMSRETLAPRQREMLERIRSAGQSLMTILNDVLDLSKIEAGQLRIEPRPFDLARLLANVDSLMGQAAHSKGLKLRIDTPPGSCRVLRGDGLRLEQILFNLTANAIKFTERGAVSLNVRMLTDSASEVRLRFEVRDSGIGIPAEAQDKLFSPFVQADGGIGRRFGGTGLGLSICKRLVGLMGGQIGVHSQPGLGSTFWFELPFEHCTTLPDSDGDSTRTSIIASNGPRLAGAHVLVVDDSAMNRDLVERALALEGASATLAADGQQAVQLLRTRPQGFDAVLMDIQMPVMDGLTAMRLIREEPALRTLPLIAFTAGVRDDQQQAAREAGADDVLPKPVDLDQMASVIQRWLPLRSHSPAAAAHPPSVTAHACPANAEQAFPAIEGIDHERAAQRLGQDREMFLHLLSMLFEDNAEAVAHTRQALSRGERDEAARRMHTLASNAGFVCAYTLEQAARALEQAIDTRDDTVDARLDELQQHLERLQLACQPWCAPH